MYGTLDGDPNGSGREKDLFHRGIRLGIIGMMLQYVLEISWLPMQFKVHGDNLPSIIPVMVDHFGEVNFPPNCLFGYTKQVTMTCSLAFVQW